MLLILRKIVLNFLGYFLWPVHDCLLYELENTKISILKDMRFYLMHFEVPNYLEQVCTLW